MTPDETAHHVNESADKIVLTTKIKRGTETRDQDEIKVKVKGDDAVDSVRKLNTTLEALTAETTDRLREMQPDAGGED